MTLREAQSRRNMSAATFWLPDRLLKALRRLRATKQVAANVVVREALEEWFQRRKKGGHK